eukprot:1083036_1
MTMTIELLLYICFIQSIMSQSSTQPTSPLICCDCITPTPTIAGCADDTECEDLICDVGDEPFCCDISWDERCANNADIICEIPTLSPTQDPTIPLCCACTEPSEDKGCPEDPICEDIVCSTQDAYCCTTEWDPLCALQAQLLCPSDTESPTSVPTSIPSLPTPTPLPIIQHPTTEPPSISPTVTTIMPTDVPTETPTEIPTEEPTLVPNSEPSKHPTFEPTLFPTLQPTSTTTDRPTFHPTIHPTDELTIDPTIDPTRFPSLNPTIVLTTDPSSHPTSFPTHEPTDFECDLCALYGIKLIHIAYGEQSCRMDNKIAVDKDTIYTHDVYETTRYWFMDSTQYKCVMSNGWGQKGVIQFHKSNEVNTETRFWWTRSHDDDDHESDDDDDLETCLTYAVNDHATDNGCDGLQAVFLPLCDKNYNCLSADVLNEMISKVYPRKVHAKGMELNDTVGIMVHFKKKMVDEFKICLKHATVDSNGKIGIANQVIFKMNDEYEACGDNDGLPCLNFDGSDECEKECKCKDGLKEISVKYLGSSTASRIVFYYDLNEICVFLNVDVGQEIMCSLQFSMYSKFKSETEYIIFYDHGTDCKGAFDTSCPKDIAHNFGYGPCYELQLMSWQDVNGNSCDV